MDKNFLDHLASEWTKNDYPASTPKEPLQALAHLTAVQNAYINRPVFATRDYVYGAFWSI